MPLSSVSDKSYDASCPCPKLRRFMDLKEVEMNTTKYLSSEQVSHIFTTYSPGTIRKLAQIGRIPVACWVGREPGFRRDPETIRVLIDLTEVKPNGRKRQ